MTASISRKSETRINQRIPRSDVHQHACDQLHYFLDGSQGDDQADEGFHAGAGIPNGESDRKLVFGEVV